MKKIILPFVLTVVLLAATFYPALADAPYIWTIRFEGQRSYVASCDGFRILEDFVTNWTFFDFYDSEGNLDRQVVHVSGYTMIYNSKNPENFLLHDTFAYKHIYEGGLGSGDDTIVGAYSSVTVPGYGAIFFEVGRITISPMGQILFKAGQHDWFTGETQALCAYLSGN